MNRECTSPSIAVPPIVGFGLRSTMGQALETFCRARRLSPADLASWLSVDEKDLDKMAELGRPEPAESDFYLQCEAIARSTGGDAFALRTLLRWLRTHG